MVQIIGVCVNENNEVIRNEEGTLCQVVDENGYEFLQYLSVDIKYEDDGEINKADSPVVCDEDSAAAGGSGINNSQSTMSEGMTKCLLDLYSKYFTDVGPFKRFKNLKAVWEQISSELSQDYYPVTPAQCESRLKRVKRNAKKAYDNNKTSGNEPRVVKYEDELQRIKSMDYSFLPKVRLGVGISDVQESSPKKFKYDSESSSDDFEVSKRKKKKSAQKTQKKSPIDVIREIFERCEVNKMKRHEEKMKMMRDIFFFVNNQEVPKNS